MAPSDASTSTRTLSALYLIADLGYADDQGIDLVDAVSAYLRAGGRLVSLRPAGGDDRRLMRTARRLAGLVYAAHGTFLVHRRLDIAMLAGADGLHLPSHGLRRRDVVQLLDHSAILARSCHDRREVMAAEREGIGFATLGPMFESVSKPGYGPGLDAASFASSARDTSMPLFALGGVVPERVAQAFEAGASGVGVVGGIIGADDPFEATTRYLEALREVEA